MFPVGLVSDACVWLLSQAHREEGAVILNQAYSIGGPPVKAQTWAGVTMVGELDVLELRDATGHTIARGRRDTTLPEV